MLKGNFLQVLMAVFGILCFIGIYIAFNVTNIIISFLGIVIFLISIFMFYKCYSEAEK